MKRGANLPPEQEAIRAKCVHPSGTFVAFPMEDVETSIPARFDKIVKMYPHRIAMKAGSHEIRYAQLDIMANHVARKVMGALSTSAEPVCILIDNGPDLLATMLGILKAGRFFILLDPAFPAARITAILRASQSKLIVHQQRQSLLVKVIAGDCQLLEVDSIEATPDTDPVAVTVAPNDAATVFYTSGSTGEAKGVVHSHRSLLHLTLRRTNNLHVSPEDRMSLLSTGTSNVVLIAFGAILNGAALIPFDVRKEGISRLKHWLLSEKVSICFISTQFFRSLCDSLTDVNGLPDLRVIRLSSEAARRSDFELYRRHFTRNCILVNGLSSSETGVTRKYFVNHDSPVATDTLPIGYHVEGVEILLLDDNGEPVGFDKDGEIVVRSKYLASGYWNNPALTAAKFKKDPRESEKTIYYTGDLGLMRRDGCLIHKGRKDFRIKIRGYGVDLLEVENAILSHSDIKEAVVTTETKEDGTSRLIAYFVCDREPPAQASELRNYLRSKLADYMIPSIFIKIDRLPLTSNGKIERAALPKPDNQRPNISPPYVQAQNETEGNLVQIWEEVLDVHPIGRDDNFFDLGGHSLSASRVVSRVIEQFQLEIPLRSLFESPTIADMAGVIAAYQGKTLDEQGLSAFLDELESLSDEDAKRLAKINPPITPK